MFIRCFTPSISVAVYAAVEYGTMDSCPIDQTPVQDFNVDPATGRCESDITKMLRAQTKFEQDKLYKELIERKVDLTELTPAQLRHEVSFGRSRLCQSPSELADYAEAIQQKAFDDAESKRQKELDSYKRGIEDSIIESEREKKKASKESKKD